MKMNIRRYILSLTALLVAAACGRPAEPPADMVFFEGGTMTMGADDTQPNEYPAHPVTVSSFYLSGSPVTVAEFRTFAEETGYVTDAERFGNSAVFDVESGTWSLVEGADWRRPLGPGGPAAKDNHPVTQVSWNDARAYCEWAGVRLPTEAEWAFAARQGNKSGDRFSWGDELVQNAAYKANVWQGRFPDSVAVEDGYLYTSPVGAFGTTGAGLTDMGGNVWEWTQSTYKLYPGNPYPFAEDPKNKVIRGGSFLCDSTVCFGYRVTARNFNSRESATVNMGFRTARSAE